MAAELPEARDGERPRVAVFDAIPVPGHGPEPEPAALLHGQRAMEPDGDHPDAELRRDLEASVGVGEVGVADLLVDDAAADHRHRDRFERGGAQGGAKCGDVRRGELSVGQPGVCEVDGLEPDVRDVEQ